MSERASRLLPSRAVLCEVALLAVGLLGYLGFVRFFSTDVLGGADSWGYVSEAARLSHGRFYEPERVLAPLGLAEDAEFTQPLGYMWKGRGGTVPIYPVGYPLLMALAITVAGHQAAFWVTPLLAAGTLLLTYLLGRPCFGRVGGAVAAVLVGVLANFLWGAFQPLSDVPAAFFCALALFALLAVRPGAGADVLLGAALGFGVWVRPNMALLVAVVGAWLLFRREWRRLLRAGIALAPFLVVGALLNWHLFGAPWRTGYGEIAFGAPIADVLARGLRHLLRLNTQQAGVGLALLALALLWNRLPVARRVLLASVFGAFVLFFAAYRIDDYWWYFRFLVPTMPAVAVLEAGFFVHLAGPGRRRRLRVAAAAVAAAAVVGGEVGYGLVRRVYGLQWGEQRYPNAARLAAAKAEAPAVVLAMQHSGSLRYYANLPTARYDIASPRDLAATLVRVSERGARVYLLADDWELEKITNEGRGFLLAGATQLGHVTPGYAALFLLDPQEAAEDFRRVASPRRRPGEAASFGDGWERSARVWHVRGPGEILLPAESGPAIVRVCASESALVVRRPGLTAATVRAGACADVPLLPGASEGMAVSPSDGGSTVLPPVQVLEPAALRSQDMLSTAYMVPQVARVAGEGGSFWQTDVVLVNPQPHPLRITGLFLRSGRDNGRAQAATVVLAPGAAVTLRDVLRNPEFERLGGRGALLAVAGEPGTPCSDPGCRFFVAARTHNAVATATAPDAGEWLPGLPPEAGMAGGLATFADVRGGRASRASVGMASWSDRPLRVRVHAAYVSGGPAAVRDAIVPPFGHVRVDLGEWTGEGTVQVELLGPTGSGRLFPYLSLVDGSTGATRHLLPDAVQVRTTAPPPMPRAITGVLTRDL